MDRDQGYTCPTLELVGPVRGMERIVSELRIVAVQLLANSIESAAVVHDVQFAVNAFPERRNAEAGREAVR